VTNPRTPAEALRRAAWKAFGAAAFSLRCHDSAYAEDRVSDEEKYAAECVTEQRIGYTLLVEADRLDALPVAELSANAVMRFGDAVCDSLHVTRGSAWVNGRETIAALRAAGFAVTVARIVEVAK